VFTVQVKQAFLQQLLWLIQLAISQIGRGADCKYRFIEKPIRVAPVAGNFLSIYATSGGKILLSTLQDQAIRDLLGPELQQFTPKTPTLPQLLEQLEQVRADGFAYDFDEHTIGVGAIAVGLQTPQGRYAIDVVGPVWRIEQSLDSVKAALLKCQQDLINGLRSIG
jgi:DNA-binding IclR family transcriptional regulator